MSRQTVRSAWRNRNATLTITVVVALVSLAGCFSPIVKNGPLAERNPQSGYRFDTLRSGPGNTDDVFVCLCFSGGGTRAAALSFGVLEALRDTPIAAAGDRPERRLLDEVDVISSVSGGSFTAVSYGLKRDALFDGRFERDFLKKNVQNRLLFMLLSPSNLLLLPYVILDRMDLVADYYDKAVFDRRTYRDLLNRGDRPLLVVNATNMATGKRFEFNQDDFDLLGSDLATLPVGHAVAASSAVPLIFSPLRLKYYPGSVADSAIRDALSDPSPAAEHDRRYKWASSLAPETNSAGETPTPVLDAKKHRYLYLLDGALSGNLGVMHVVDEIRSGHIRSMIDAGKIKKLVVILVDANTDTPQPIEHKAAAPGLFLMAVKAGTTSIHNYSESTTEVLRDLLREEANQHLGTVPERHPPIPYATSDTAPTDLPAASSVQTYFVEVNLHKIADPKVRRRFLSMPTSLFLWSDDVDGLIDMGRNLVTTSPEFQRLLSSLNVP